MKYLPITILSIFLIILGFAIKNGAERKKIAEEQMIILDGRVLQVTHDGATTRYEVEFEYNGIKHCRKTCHYSQTEGKYQKGDFIKIKYDQTEKNKLIMVFDDDLVPVASNHMKVYKCLVLFGVVFLIISAILIVKSCF